MVIGGFVGDTASKIDGSRGSGFSSMLLRISCIRKKDEPTY